MPDPYSAVLYPARPLRRGHPDRMASIGRLLGMSPAPVTSCRVLEVGCSDAGNLAALAVALPGSQFVGMDLAAHAVASGQETVRAVGLDNVHLSAADLLDWDPGKQQFDYVIAHGFYSWVPVEVRDRLFAIIAATLASQGIAYVSYNVYPGCFLRKMMSGMMHLHVDQLEDPQQQIAQSRELMKFLMVGQTGDSHNNRILREEAQQVLSRTDENIFHDDLAQINDPVWFRDFAAHASRFGLAYLADSELFSTSDLYLPEPVRQLLGQMSPIDREQYLDFLKCRRFRGSLLVHEGACPKREIRPEVIDHLLISSSFEAVSATPSLDPGVVEQFKDRQGNPLQLDHAFSKAALVHLGGQYPRAVPFEATASAAAAMLAPRAVTQDDREALRTVVLRGYLAGVFEFETHEPGWASLPGAYPKASPLVRYQARCKHPFVSSLRHLAIDVDDELACALLPLLDGRSDLAALEMRLRPAFPEAEDLRQQIESRLLTAAQNALLLA